MRPYIHWHPINIFNFDLKLRLKAFGRSIYFRLKESQSTRNDRLANFDLSVHFEPLVYNHVALRYVDYRIVLFYMREYIFLQSMRSAKL